MLMGAVTGIGVGGLQALVLARARISGAIWWAAANPPAWALAWLVSSDASAFSGVVPTTLGRPPHCGPGRWRFSSASLSADLSPTSSSIRWTPSVQRSPVA